MFISDLKIKSLGVQCDFTGFPSCYYNYLVSTPDHTFQVKIECGKQGYLGWVAGKAKPFPLPYRSFTCMAEAILLTLQNQKLLDL